MSTKNIYLFKVSIRDTQTNTEVPVQLFRGLFQEIFDREGRNNALKLTYEDTEPNLSFRWGQCAEKPVDLH